MNRQRLEERLAALRQEEDRPQTCVQTGFCAKTGRAFTVQFKRYSATHRFQIAGIEIVQGDGKQNGLFSKLVTGRQKAPALVLKPGELDYTGFACPECGARGRVVYCGDCDGLICRGRTRTLANGIELFACRDSCGGTGALVKSDRPDQAMTEPRKRMGHGNQKRIGVRKPKANVLLIEEKKTLFLDGK